MGNTIVRCIITLGAIFGTALIAFLVLTLLFGERETGEVALTTEERIETLFAQDAVPPPTRIQELKGDPEDHEAVPGGSPAPSGPGGDPSSAAPEEGADTGAAESAEAGASGSAEPISAGVDAGAAVAGNGSVPSQEEKPHAVKSTGDDTAAAQVQEVAAKQSPPPAYAVTRWWPAEPGESGFGIRHVGALEGEQSIAILFNAAVSADSIGDHIVVRDVRGGTLEGDWLVEEDHPRVAAFEVPDTGRYTVIVNGRLADRRGRALGANAHGPVFVP